MKRSTIFFLTVSCIFSYKVNEKLIKKVKPIKFRNFKGKGRYDSRKAIRNIGTILSEKTTPVKRGYYSKKYSMIRVVSKTEPKKMGADIFFIHKYAQVNHVNNIRLILASYLTREYSYSYADAYVIAKFITYYNAVYRGDMAHFNQFYKKKVTALLTKSTAGLDTYYKRWPGKSRIVIPISKKVDTSIISDKKVIDKFRNEKDKGIDDRKDLVNIKEKEIKKEKDEIAKEKDNIERERTEISRIKNKKERESRRKELAEKEKEVAKRERKNKEKENEVRADRKEIAKDEGRDPATVNNNTGSDNKNGNDSNSIAVNYTPPKKERTIQRNIQSENVMQGKIYYLSVDDKNVTGGHYNNDMFIIDIGSKKVLAKSTLKNIDGKEYDIFSEGVVVIAHNKSEPNTHNLVLLDKNNVTPLKRGKDNIYWKSFVEIQENEIFAVIKNGNKYYLGKFNAKLEKLAISKGSIDQDSFISYFDKNVYIGRPDKKILVLNRATLNKVGLIEP